MAQSQPGPFLPQRGSAVVERKMGSLLPFGSLGGLRDSQGRQRGRERSVSERGGRSTPPLLFSMGVPHAAAQRIAGPTAGCPRDNWLPASAAGCIACRADVKASVCRRPRPAEGSTGRLRDGIFSVPPFTGAVLASLLGRTPIVAIVAGFCTQATVE